MKKSAADTVCFSRKKIFLVVSRRSNNDQMMLLLTTKIDRERNSVLFN